MIQNQTLFREIFGRGLRSPVTQKLLYDLGVALMPLVLIELFGG